eukprot:jgi/Bigna1/69921/fgenesh1_pg.10_\
MVTIIRWAMGSAFLWLITGVAAALNEHDAGGLSLSLKQSLRLRGGGRTTYVRPLPHTGPTVGLGGVDPSDNRVLGSDIWRVRKTFIRDNMRETRPLPAVKVLSLQLEEPWGLELEPRESSLGAIVKSIDPAGQAANFKKVKVGMHVLSINGEDVRLRVWTSIQRHIDRCKEKGGAISFQLLDPSYVAGGEKIRLRMRRPLGLELAEDTNPQINNKLVGTKVARLVSGGSALSQGQVRVGMRILSVNNITADRATPADIRLFLREECGKDNQKACAYVDIEFSTPFYVKGETLNVSLPKPLGLELEEDKATGEVFVRKVLKEGSACAVAGNAIVPGMHICSVQGIDVLLRGVATVKAILSSVPPSEKVQLCLQMLRQNPGSSSSSTSSSSPTQGMTMGFLAPLEKARPLPRISKGRLLALNLSTPLGMVFSARTPEGLGAKLVEHLENSRVPEGLLKVESTLEEVVVNAATRLCWVLRWHSNDTLFLAPSSVEGIDVRNRSLDTVQRLIQNAFNPKCVTLKFRLPPDHGSILLSEQLLDGVLTEMEGNSPSEKARHIVARIEPIFSSPRNLSLFLKSVRTLTLMIEGKAYEGSKKPSWEDRWPFDGGLASARRRAFPRSVNSRTNISRYTLLCYQRELVIDAVQKAQEKYNRSNFLLKVGGPEADSFTKKVCEQASKFPPEHRMRLSQLNERMVEGRQQRQIAEKEEQMSTRMTEFEAYELYWSQQKGVSKRSKVAGSADFKMHNDNWLAGF